MTNYVTAKNTKLQENPTLRADGDYVGVALWGDAGELPTVVLLKANATLFSYATPGSMFAVDLNVVPPPAPGGADTVYLAAAGKAVAEDADAFNKDFAAAWKKLIEFGVSF